MRFYGALQEGPQGVYSIVITDFDSQLVAATVLDRSEQVDHLLGAIDELEPDDSALIGVCNEVSRWTISMISWRKSFMFSCRVCVTDRIIAWIALIIDGSIDICPERTSEGRSVAESGETSVEEDWISLRAAARASLLV